MWFSQQAVFSSNPATLAYILRPEIFYNYRSYNWIDDDDLDIDRLFSWSLGMASAFRFGKVAFSFNRREEGKTSVARFYGQTFSLAYAMAHGNIGAGSMLKLFNKYIELFSDYTYEPEPRYVSALDLGVLYRAKRSTSEWDESIYQFVSFDPKISLVEDRLAFFSPIGFFFSDPFPSDGESINSLESIQIHPALIASIPFGKSKNQLNLALKSIV